METSEQLLEKLNRQFRTGEPAAVLLRTLTALEYAIRHHPPKVQDIEPAALPTNIPSPQIVQASDEPESEPVIEILEVDEAEIEEELRTLREAAELRQIRQQHLRPDLTHVDNEESGAQEAPFPGRNASSDQPASTSLPHDPRPQPSTPDPTIPLINKPTDLNESMADSASSLNDRFRVAETADERSRFLEPIDDLRKAIGINDRFRYVNELFDGDSEAFSDTLGVINAAGSYDQACLKLEEKIKEKGSWHPDNPALRELRQLLERRYS